MVNSGASGPKTFGLDHILASPPRGQLLAIVVMAVMAIEMAVGFALVTAVYRKRQADTTEGLETMKH